MSLLLVCAAALLVGPAAATARPGELDRTLGRDGRVVLPLEADHVADAVPDGAGALVLADEGHLVRIGTTGRLDRRVGSRRGAVFASDGNVGVRTILRRPEGGLLLAGGLDLAHLQVAPADGRGRASAAPWRFHRATGIQASGDAILAPGPSAGSTMVVIPGRATAVVDRRAVALLVLVAFDTATGRLVEDFGDDGVASYPVSHLFGVRAALAPTASGITAAVVGEGERDVVVRVDRAGRLLGAEVLASRSDTALRVGDDILLGARGGLLRRLRSDGAPDATFGRGGVLDLPRTTTVTAATSLREGGYLVAGLRAFRTRRPANRLVVARVDDAGRLDPRFWDGGRRELSFPRVRVDQVIRRIVPRSRGSVFLVGNVGDGRSDIREDFGPTFLGVMAMRTADPSADVVGRTARVDRRGRLRVRVVCRIATTSVGSCVSAITVRHGGRRLATRAVRLVPGVPRTVVLPTGARGRRIAVRRGAVDVDVLGFEDRVRRPVRLTRAG